MVESLQFVAANPRATRADKAATRTIIRSHIMKQTRRAQKIRKEGAQLKKGADVSDERRAGEKPNGDLICRNQWVTASSCAQSISGIARTEEEADGAQTGAAAGLLTLLGAGNVDPFCSYPPQAMPGQTDDLIYYSLQCKFPALLPLDTEDDIQRMTFTWMRSALADSLLLHAILYAASSHRRFLQGQAGSASVDDLQRKAVLYRQMQDVVCDPDPTRLVDPKTIIMILQLASHDLVETSSEYGMFNPPLWKMQWLNVYGTLNPSSWHWEAIQGCVARRGGLDGLEAWGLTKILIFIDIIVSTLQLSHSSLPLLHDSSTITSLQQLSSLSPFPTTSETSPGPGFIICHNLDLDNDLTNTLFDLALLNSALQLYSDGDLAQNTLIPLADARNSLQHRLLSVPAALDMSDSRTPLHELFRLSALIYSVNVTFPIPGQLGMKHRLVVELSTILQNSQLDGLHEILGDALIWILVLSGAAADGMDERWWFVNVLKELNVHVGLVEWRDLKALLERFLWLGSACDAAGIALWKDIQ